MSDPESFESNMLLNELRLRLNADQPLFMLGVYDVFSSLIAAKYSDIIFVSGYGFSFSYYGLPDDGYNTWSDLVQFVFRLRNRLPKSSIIVDIDNGFGGPEQVFNVCESLKSAGATGIILEYKLFYEKILAALEFKNDLLIISRTDSGGNEALRRSEYLAETGVDCILVDGLSSIEQICEIKNVINNKPLAFNIIKGGKSELININELRKAGVNLINYSTPCLFAVQDAIESALDTLIKSEGIILPGVDLDDNQRLINLYR
jgi:2-methylisocitrate lyase-like PEP mutase family enzyme